MWIWLLYGVAEAAGMLHSLGIIYVGFWHEHSYTTVLAVSASTAPKSEEGHRN